MSMNLTNQPRFSHLQLLASKQEQSLVLIRCKSEAGMAVVLLIFIFPILLAALAAGIDLGIARWEKNRMQAISDTAALAGAYHLESAQKARATASKMAALASARESTVEKNKWYSVWPQLQFNATNRPEGDIVLGISALGKFMPTTNLGNSLKVHLRRHGQSLDSENEPQVSSSAPKLPWLFGLPILSMFQGRLLKEGKSLPLDGISVQSVSVAKLQNALRVGAAIGNLPGALPFNLHRDFWESLPKNTAVGLKLDKQGKIWAQNGTLVGAWSLQPLFTVGESVPEPKPGPEEDWTANMGFVPIAQLLPSFQDPVVAGFGLVQAIVLHQEKLSFVVSQKRIAPANASAILVDGLPTSIPSENVEVLFMANRTLPASLLVPVLTQ